MNINCMHELSIAQNILDIILENTRGTNANRVTKVIVDVGAVSGVIPDSLLFVWNLTVQGTIAENAVLKINLIQPRAICRQCHSQFKPDASFQCPQCNSSDFEIEMGRELKVKSIIIE